MVSWDAIVVGGGFVGATLAVYLAQRRGLANVLLLEREPDLLRRASRNNQARVHGGYHYPRSLLTAHRCQRNLPRFMAHYGACVRSDFSMIYALSRQRSKIGERQFERFASEIGAPLVEAPPAIVGVFAASTVSKVYLANEHVFDVDRLRPLVWRDLSAAGVSVQTGINVREICPGPEGLVVRADGRAPLGGRMVFNCTYSNLQALASGPLLKIRHDLSELLLIRPPVALAGLGVTIVDGPFFSLMPHPPSGLHSLWHVRLSPHERWVEDGVTSPESLLRQPRASRGRWMLRDAERYLPCLARGEICDSIYEVKTVVSDDSLDDRRPVLVRRRGPGGCLFDVLGGKIDSVYDLCEHLDHEAL